MNNLRKKSDAELIEIVESDVQKYGQELIKEAERILNDRGYAIEDTSDVSSKKESNSPKEEKKQMSTGRIILLAVIFTFILGSRIATSNGGSWSTIGIILPILIIGMLLIQLATKKK